MLQKTLQIRQSRRLRRPADRATRALSSRDRKVIRDTDAILQADASTELHHRCGFQLFEPARNAFQKLARYMRQATVRRDKDADSDLIYSLVGKWPPHYLAAVEFIHESNLREK